MKSRSRALIGLLLWASIHGGALADDLEITNETLAVKWNGSTGRAALQAKPSGRTFLKDVTLGGGGGTAKIINVTNQAFGAGQAIEISSASRADRDVVELYPKLPFALLRSSVFNQNAGAKVFRNVTTLSATADLSKPAGELKSFGTGGLLAPDKNPGSYAWLAITEPLSRNGVVFGWLTHDRGSGVLFSAVTNDAVRVEARLDYGRLGLGPGAREELETLAVGCFDDARLGLEVWADAVAKVYDIHLLPQPAGYCTWYSQPHGGASDETHLAELAAFSATNLAPFGFSVVQIDDKWQAGISTNGPKRNFTTHRTDGPYPHGMKAASDNIKSLGLVPGIWFMPFAGTYYAPFFKDHQDWFVKRDDGTPYETAWGGTCLDMTQPGARAHLRDVASRICRDWGYRYIKVDGLWTGTGTKQQYVNSGFKDDKMGDAVFSDPQKSNIEAYRDGLKLLREAAGPGVFILGCNGPQNMRSYGGAFGLVDAMRIGPDNGAAWKSLTRGAIFGSRHYFLHGRVWYNDPDPVYVRASMPLNHAQLNCSWVALSGQLNLSSEWLPGLPPERLDLLKRTMPGHGLLPRPVDLFENEPPRIWLLTDDRRDPRRDVIGVFNWESTGQTFDCPLDRLGLNANTEYVAFDYWQNALVPMIKGRLQLSVPAESCRILAVRPRTPRPQLLSTSRHITQGIVDVLEERWDDATRTLRGRSQLVGHDASELRVVLPDDTGSWKAEAVDLAAEDQAGGVRVSQVTQPGLVRVKLESPTSRTVNWALRFH